MACAAVLSGITAYLWYLRLPQLTAFLVAAGVRGQLHPLCRITDLPEVPKWPNDTSADGEVLARLNSGALVTYHPEYHRFDPLLASASLAKAKELGFAWLRSDVRWFEVLPKGSDPFEPALTWYISFYSAARKTGMRTMIVLGSPPPSSSRDDELRIIAWERFVHISASRLRGLCDVYQLLNEPNNPIYRLFEIRTTAQAIKRASTIIRSLDPSARTAINISVDIPGWRKYLDQLLDLCGDYIDVIGFDYYPGTWSVGRGSHWDQLFEVAADSVRDEPDSKLRKKVFAIFETGYSTNSSSRSWLEQAHYYTSLNSVIKQLRQILSHERLIFGIYELSDGDTANHLDPEAHFGIFTTTLEPKLAVGPIRDLMQAL
jgi:hypothetical protein